MDNIKNDSYYIQKIRTDLEFITAHMHGIDIEELNENEVLLDAVKNGKTVHLMGLLSEGGVLGIVRPKTDPMEKTEEMLSRIYGSISLQRCIGRDGREHIVMLKEAEI